MNRFLLALFVLLSALILYQGILGKNGILEKYSIAKDKEKLELTITLLQGEINDNSKYIEELKKNPAALEKLANDLGFFRDNVKLLKIIDESKDDAKNGKKSEALTQSEKEILMEKIKKANEFDEQVEKIRNWIKIGFFIFFGIFIFLIFFGKRKNNEK
jgi:cell division protein FtsB